MISVEQLQQSLAAIEIEIAEEQASALDERDEMNSGSFCPTVYCGWGSYIDNLIDERRELLELLQDALGYDYE